MKHILRKIILSAAIVVMAFASATAGINDLPVKTINGKKYHYYEVQPQETVYSLCHRFGVTREQIQQAVRKVFDLRPAAIIDELDLKRPIYEKTAAYGHFGRIDVEFPWERLNKVDALKAAIEEA